MGNTLHKNHYECELMAQQLRAWWSEPKLISTASPEERRSFFDRWLTNSIYPQRKWIGVKHPLLALCMTDLVMAWGNDIKYIWSHRPIEQSIKSLNKAKWLGWDGYCEQIQQEIWNSIHEFLVDKEHIKIDCDILNTEPLKPTLDIIEYLDLDLPHSRAAEISATICRKNCS